MIKEKGDKLMAGKMTRLEKQWILYDVGNSAFTMLCTTIIPIYFKNIAEAGNLADSDSTAFLSFTLSLSTILVAILGPTLGTMADTKNYKKPLFVSSFLVGAIGCMAMAFASKWLAFLAVFCVARTGYQLSLIFYDSMLTDVAPADRMDEVSARGYAWGYIGSCIPFILSLLLVLFYEKLGITMELAMGIAFLLVAAWWVLLTVPLLTSYRQVYYQEASQHPVRSCARRLAGVFSDLGKEKKILFFLLAFFFYIDGVYTIIDMATAYGTALGLDTTGLLLALLLTQVVAFPAALIFGKLSRKVAVARLMLVCIGAYFCVALYALGLREQYQFWILAVCVGLFQGAIQSMSRSYFAKIIPADKSGEYFGIYDICGKGASFMGTMLVSVVSQITGSTNLGVGALAFMFLAGFLLFIKADRTGMASAK